IFPKFSSSRSNRGGKSSEPVPPPHTLQPRGRCDLTIGPHTFPSTAFFEVCYLSADSNAVASSKWRVPPSSTGSWQANTPYGSQEATSSTSAPDPVPEPSQNPTPLTLSSTLISQINEAATNNPSLSNLLQLAAQGEATTDQLETIGIFIKSLAQAAASTPLSPPVKEFDLVIEFSEAPSNRWLIPRGPVFYETQIDDVIITTRIPFPERPDSISKDTPPQVTTFCLKRSSLALRDTVIRWAGDQKKMANSRKILDQIALHPRIYLAHQIVEGHLLSKLQASVPRKPRAEGSTPLNINPTPALVSKGPESESSAAAKRQRITQPKKAPVPHQIKCITCRETDVPLIWGGRYCRPCVESGKASADTAELPPAYKNYLSSRRPIELDASKPIVPSITPAAAPQPAAVE
ncbi:hypothetical protein C8J56DRAFT_773286, partial [Mycena floridula]